jgi:hypothetical protein
MFYNVGNVNLFALQTDGVDKLVQKLARGPHERTTLKVFVPPRAFSNEHYPGIFGAFSWHCSGSSFIQITSSANADFFI